MTDPILLTAQQAGEQIGRTSQTVRRAAARTGIGQQVGGVWVFTADDLPRLLAATNDAPGNPNFGATPVGKSPSGKPAKKAARLPPK